MPHPVKGLDEEDPVHLAGVLESDAIIHEAQRQQFGCDLLDVEALLAVSFPRP